MNRSIIVVLLLTVCCVVIGEAYADVEVYTHPTNGYQIEYPKGLFVIDRENIDILYEMSNSLDETEGPIASMLKEKETMIIEQDAVIMVKLANHGLTLTITCQNMNFPFTLPLIKSLVSPIEVEQMEAMFAEPEVLDAGSIIRIGDIDFFHFAFKGNAANSKYFDHKYKVEAFVYICLNDTSLYELRFVNTYESDPDFANADMIKILESFIPGSQ